MSHRARFFSRSTEHVLQRCRIDPSFLLSVTKLSGYNEWPLVHCFKRWAFMFSPMPRLAFSAFVTGSKCQGFTQRLFLHKWSNCKFSPISPRKAIKENLCALMYFGLLRDADSAKFPYPEEPIAPTHSQHSSSLRWSTLAQNLSSTVFIFPLLMIACAIMGRQREQA